MKKALLIVLLASTFTTLVATAQGLRTPPSPADLAQRRVDRLTRVLALTGAQQEQALSIFTNAAAAQAGLRDSLKTARDAVKAAVKGNDIATIERSATTIGTLTAQQISIASKAEAALYAMLTPEQQSKLAGRRGGPGGRGPGRLRGRLKN